MIAPGWRRSRSSLGRVQIGYDRPAGGPTRYHKIGHDTAAIENLFVALFLEAHAKPPKRIVLELDATDDPLRGRVAADLAEMDLRGVVAHDLPHLIRGQFPLPPHSRRAWKAIRLDFRRPGARGSLEPQASGGAPTPLGGTAPPVPVRPRGGTSASPGRGPSTPARRWFLTKGA